MNHKYRPAVLTVAGSDSGGGAGIQTDLRTFNAFRVYGCSVITAVTAQNPNEVRRVDIMPVDSVRNQFETVLDVMPVHFAKTGMLGSREIVECTAELAEKYGLNLIVDPVMVSTSGVKLLEDSAIAAMCGKLFYHAAWITPNIPEAEFICNKKLTTPSDLAEAAVYLHEKYKCNVILKSGHALSGDYVTDVVCYEGELFALSSPEVNIRKNTAHGTGCTLSAALTAAFALELDWQNAVKTAKGFVYGALFESTALTESLSQMYPPEKNYIDTVTLKKI